MTCVVFNVLESFTCALAPTTFFLFLSLSLLALALALVHMVLQISFTNLRFYHLRKSGGYYSTKVWIFLHLQQFSSIFTSYCVLTFSALYDPLEKQNTHQIVNPLSVDPVGKKSIFFASDRMLFN